MKKIILCFLMCSIFNIEVNASMSETGEIIMSENQSLNLISEITRIGSTEKWNSSLFFEGSLKIHVLKDGTITDYGMYTLSKTKFGFPVAIRVSNLNDKNKHFNFFVSTPSGLLFKNPIYVNRLCCTNLSVKAFSAI
ncbi:hypothetical protein [Acinetobacter stercoris]|uniref:Uncharacterized protein n=1 Tax=Acinetobacter stercoris TaxID=2126983 RepID=A0A2U3N4L8_9GAMM|nr:hypothetical protein [Acinetobacter stercoris]SPL72650.1 hypothetical protein KPC_3828 [Acinetobacter stercoris]